MANRTIYEIIAKAIGFGKTNKAVKNLSGSMKRFAVGLVSVTAAYKAIGVAVEGVQLAGRLEGVETAFNNMSKSAGFSANTFSKLDKALNGTVDSLTVMEQANAAMLLGIADSDDQMAELFDTAQRLAQAVGKDATFGIESLVTGLGRQSKLMLDNLGIIVDTNKAYEEYAQELGKTSSKLTEAERKQAFINKALSEGERLVSGFGTEVVTSAQKMEQFSASIKNLKMEIGEALIESGVIEQLNTFTGWLVKNTKAWSDSNKSAAEHAGISEELADDYDNMIERVADYQFQLGALTDAMDIMNNLSDEQQDSSLKLGWALNDLSAEQKDYLTHLMGTNEWSETLTALDKELESGKVNLLSKTRELNSHLEAEADVKTRILEEDAEIVDMENSIASLKEKINPIEFKHNSMLFEKIELSGKIREATEDEMAAYKAKMQILKASATIEMWAGSQILGNLANLNEANKGSAELTKNLTIAQALGDAYAGGARAFRDYPFPANLLVAASSVAGGLAQVANVQSAYNQQNAQYGFEGVVSEPTQFTVGEGGASEYVSVTPLEGVNNAGGGGVTVNVTGNVMSEQFVEEELSERIQEAVRKGVDFGIS